MGEIKQSASAKAQAQAGIVNVGDSVTVNLSTKFELSGFIGDFLAPRKARRKAEAIATINDAIAHSMSTYMAISPTVSAERAYLMAVTGIMYTDRQADNLLSVLSLVASEADGGVDPSSISDTIRDRILLGAREADDEMVRDMWKRLFLVEASDTGSFSPRTVSVLSSMDATDARDFSALCTCIVHNERAKTYRDKVHVLLHSSLGGRCLNGGAFDYGRLSSLESIGLLSTSVFDVKSLNPRQTLELSTANSVIVARNNHDEPRACSFHVSLTRAGLELSTLCEWGTCPNLDKFAAIRVRECGLTLDETGGNDESD